MNKLSFAPLALLLAATIGVASAAEPARKSAAKSGPGDSVLTPAQLRQCEEQKTKVRADADEATQARTAMAADQAEIAKSAEALADGLTTLDRTSAEAVDAYNAKVDERDRMIERYQAKVAAFNGRAEGIRSSRESYSKSCENRRYDDRDLADLRKGKKP